MQILPCPIVEFYPSITEDLLDRVISWAKSLTEITEEQISIIKHARKSLLFYSDKTWVKKSNDSLFDVTMGSYDGAEVCELVGLFILNKLSAKFGQENVGLYRDDGLLLLDGTGGRLADRARKDLHEIFHQLDLKITAEINNHNANFLDVTLNLQEEKYSPYMKPNNDPLYVDRRSNHPPSIIQHLPKAINKRISTLSSDESCFNSTKHFYQNALSRSNYNVTFQYSNDNTSKIPPSNRRNRKRKIIWFNPPYSKNVRTNIARNFLHLIDKHFPKSSRLHKIFNRNTVKVSYSCMPNVKTVISNHNRHLLEKRNEPSTDKNCNCRARNECPLNGKCLTKSIVYKAEITATDVGETKEYIGMTAGTFKERFANHKKSLNNVRYSTETELSKYAWKLKQSKRKFTIKWSIIKRVPSRAAGGSRCNLCLEEKLSLVRSDCERTLNKRSELFAKCRHRNKFSAKNFKMSNARASELSASANR